MLLITKHVQEFLKPGVFLLLYGFQLFISNIYLQTFGEIMITVKK